MSILNEVMRRLFDAALYPFHELHPLVGLLVVSLITAVGMLLVFRATSNQEGIAAVKRRIHACLFEIRLFNDDLRAILRAQIEILRHNLTYLRLSAIPMLWILPPLVLVIAQLQFHYGYQGLDVGATALVKVRLKDTANGGNGLYSEARPALELETPPGLRVDSRAMWIPVLKEMAWRISAHRAGDYGLHLVMDGKTYAKTVHVSDAVVRRSPARLERGFVNQLLYPAEEPLPEDSPIRSIMITYPDRSISVLGWRFHWMVVYFALSIVLAFVLRKPFKVNL